MSAPARIFNEGAPSFARYGRAGVTPAETKQLWWLLDGGIMQADFRERLRRSWGLCPRHAWAFMAVEVALRGGLPFATAVLVEDLLARGGDHRLLHRIGSERHRLEGTGDCPTCAYVRDEPDVEESFRDAAARASAGLRLRTLLAQHRDELRCWSCPACAGGQGLVCRPHLIAGCPVPSDLAQRLRALAGRVAIYRSSLTPGVEVQVRGRTAIAWAEGLGWLAGWDGVGTWAEA